jgi:hypothetical protein
VTKNRGGTELMLEGQTRKSRRLTAIISNIITKYLRKAQAQSSSMIRRAYLNVSLASCSNDVSSHQIRMHDPAKNVANPCMTGSVREKNKDRQTQRTKA